ncbi:hypothetical protein RugamoR57_29000 [Duganella caerulea]|uniref:hypothetical protein n=1 Tax=Duganella caerulea TaxID=2885762 RepID=UPI0030EA98F3
MDDLVSVKTTTLTPLIFSGKPYAGAATIVPHSLTIPPFRSDTVHRVVIDTATKYVSINSYQTTELVSAFGSAAFQSHCDVEALKVVANWQRKYINYQSVYSAYLIGALDDKEFEEEANAYVSEARSVSPESLVDIVGRLNRLLDFKLSDSEMAEYLEVDTESVEKALNLQKTLPPQTQFSFNWSNLISGT